MASCTFAALAHLRFLQDCSGFTGPSDTLLGSADHELPSAPTAFFRATQRLPFTLRDVRRQLTAIPEAR